MAVAYRSDLDPCASYGVAAQDGTYRWAGVFNIGTIEKPRLRVVFFTRCPGGCWEVVPVSKADDCEHLGSPEFQILEKQLLKGEASVVTFETDAKQLAFLRGIHFSVAQGAGVQRPKLVLVA